MPEVGITLDSLGRHASEFPLLKIIPDGFVWLPTRIWLIQQTIFHYISYNHNKIIISLYIIYLINYYL